jgi:ParB family chromosome partitioning protein
MNAAAKANVAPAHHLSEADALKISRQMWGHGHGRFAYCTGNCEWYTPAYIVEATRAVMGSIDIDPASCARANKVVQAKRYFTRQEDGLKQCWPGNVFINPPFGNPIIRHFAEKLIDQYMRGITRQAVWVSNVSVSSAWWAELVQKGIACFAHKRIKFYGPEAETQANMLGQNIVYLGDRRASFCEEFAEIGMVMEKVLYANDD